MTKKKDINIDPKVRSELKRLRKLEREHNLLLTGELNRLQNRLYSCLDAAIDGQLAERFPESIGQVVTIELHGYNLPQGEVSNFFNHFDSSVLNLPEYAQALEASPHIAGINFFATFE